MVTLLSAMSSWFQKYFGKSDSTFVRDEVLSRLPKSITIEFIPEFDSEDNPIISIYSPEHEGLISEARTSKEANENAQDAILTYFDVPRACASLIEFEIEDVQQENLKEKDANSIRIREFKIKGLTYA